MGFQNTIQKGDLYCPLSFFILKKKWEPNGLKSKRCSGEEFLGEYCLKSPVITAALTFRVQLG